VLYELSGGVGCRVLYSVVVDRIEHGCQSIVLCI
jgi:hypothetical protein